MVRLRTRPFLSLFVHYKVMQNFYFIGIDVSKKKLDICVMSKSKVLKEEQVSNHPQAIASVIAGLKEELSMSNDSFIICAEHTGQYTYPLMCACNSVGCKLWLENPSQIKYCSGVTRGKNDKVDARRIAEYAMRFLDKAKNWCVSSNWRLNARCILPIWPSTRLSLQIRTALWKIKSSNARPEDLKR